MLSAEHLCSASCLLPEEQPPLSPARGQGDGVLLSSGSLNKLFSKAANDIFSICPRACSQERCLLICSTETVLVAYFVQFIHSVCACTACMYISKEFSTTRSPCVERSSWCQACICTSRVLPSGPAAADLRCLQPGVRLNHGSFGAWKLKWI